MATKRSAPSVHPSRHDQVPSEPSRKRRKPNLKAGPGAKSFKKAHPVNELKSRIRSLKRQLERNDSLTADVQVEKERALQAAEHELERNERAKQRNDMIGRWHKVRFFDRRKAEKRLKRARKELEGNARDEVLEKRVRDAETEVKYAVYYPLEKDYVPLFPRRKGSDGEEDEGEGVKAGERKGDPEMWEVVKRCMAEGTLDALRNGKLEDGKAGEDDSKLTVKAEKASKKRARAADHEDEDSADETGGGFWEEG